MKIYEQIIDNKIREKVEYTLAECQSGFRKGRSIQDHIFTVKQIIEKKCDHQGKKVFAGFIDLEKAFDRVPRRKLWTVLDQRGIDKELRGLKKIVRIIQNIYEANFNHVISQSRVSEPFFTNEGLVQGGGLSPLLFTIYMDEIIQECTQRTKKLHIGHRHLQRVDISEGAFADDIILIAEKEEDLGKSLGIWNEVLKKFGMTLNRNKTKVMVFGDEQYKMEIKLDDDVIEQVASFKYLGVDIQSNGSHEMDINRRLEKTSKTYYAMGQSFMNSKEISRKTKMNVFKAIYRPILTFGCETWVLNQRQKSRIQALEMKYLRRVKGVSKRDRIRNTQIRDELEIEPTLSFIEQRQLSWWGHLIRMDTMRPVKRIWEAKVQKKKKRGRPKNTWDRVIAETLKRRGTTWNEAKMIAQDKREWTKIVHKQLNI